MCSVFFDDGEGVGQLVDEVGVVDYDCTLLRSVPKTKLFSARMRSRAGELIDWRSKT